MHYLAQPGPTLPDRFAYLIGGLCHYLRAIFTRDRAAGPLTLLIHGRLRRLAVRFAALVARVEAGTLRPARVRVAPRAARVAAPRVMPGGFGWLLKLMPEGSCYAEYLEREFLADPGFAALLAVAPQAGRMARSVLWMMGRPAPEALKLPARPPRKRKPRPGPPPIEYIPYRKQPYKSHYPRSVWPSEADLKRAGRQIAREAWLKSLGK